MWWRFPLLGGDPGNTLTDSMAQSSTEAKQLLSVQSCAQLSSFWPMHLQFILEYKNKKLNTPMIVNFTIHKFTQDISLKP